MTEYLERVKMAYSASKYQLTQLLQDAWFRMGQMKRWKMTGGSASTVVNSAWAGVEDAIYEDDDPSLIYGTVVVIRDAGGLNAAPEGEMGRITDYDSSIFTITMDTLTAAVASGDSVGIASPLFPLEDMIEAANLALQRIGELDIPDTSLSVVTNQTEYTLPSTIRSRPLLVEVAENQDAGNYQWRKVQGWHVVPATAGAAWTLFIPPLPVDHALRVWYRGLHPKLTAYDSDIIETLHPELILCATLVEAYQWYNNQTGGTNGFMVSRENMALQSLEAAMVKYPVLRIVEQVHGMPHWGALGDYVPGTSDLVA